MSPQGILETKQKILYSTEKTEDKVHLLWPVVQANDSCVHDLRNDWKGGRLNLNGSNHYKYKISQGTIYHRLG